jgi:hypothetical protein
MYCEYLSLIMLLVTLDVFLCRLDLLQRRFGHFDFGILLHRTLKYGSIIRAIDVHAIAYPRSILSHLRIRAGSGIP